MRRYDYSDDVVLNQYERGVEGTDGLPLVIPRRYEASEFLPELSDDYEWQVTYKFSGKLRNNSVLEGEYGSDNVTFRRLYEILCKKFNGGVSFIDDYLVNVLPYSNAGEEIKGYLKAVKRNAAEAFADAYYGMRRKSDGTLDMRQKKALRNIEYIRNSVREDTREFGRYAATIVKEDMEAAFRDGRVSVGNVASSTSRERARLGLNPDPKFYATGRFIKDIQIFCRLEKKEWAMDRNIWV